MTRKQLRTASTLTFYAQLTLVLVTVLTLTYHAVDGLSSRISIEMAVAATKVGM